MLLHSQPVYGHALEGLLMPSAGLASNGCV